MKVRMIRSVGDLVAGQEYDVDDNLGNRLVVLGHAETSDPVFAYTDQERAAMIEDHQVVIL